MWKKMEDTLLIIIINVSVRVNLHTLRLILQALKLTTM
jgi:hypothetical protein